MEESNKRHCKRCKELKNRILDGKFPDSKNKRFKDEMGKLWSGNICPQCQVLKVKENMKQLRFKRALKEREEKQDVGTETT